MAIEGVNTAMTTLQFARVRSAQRSVEMSTGTSRRSGSTRVSSPVVRTAEPILTAERVDRLVGPATLHWIYRAEMINGKRGAKRAPQLADSEYWSFSLNRYG